MNEDSNPKNSIDLAAARAKLARHGGKRLWQSLEELVGHAGIPRISCEHEFPANAGQESTASTAAT